MKRKTQPTSTTERGSMLSFQVWALSGTEDTMPWHCIAAFKYLLEALDYVAYCQDRGSDVVFRTPCDVKTVKASGRRVVYKPDATNGSACEWTTEEILAREG